MADMATFMAMQACRALEAAGGDGHVVFYTGGPALAGGGRWVRMRFRDRPVIGPAVVLDAGPCAWWEHVDTSDLEWLMPALLHVWRRDDAFAQTQAERYVPVKGIKS